MTRKISCSCKIKNIKKQLDLSDSEYCTREKRLCNIVEEQLLELLFRQRKEKIHIKELLQIQEKIQLNVFLLSENIGIFNHPKDYFIHEKYLELINEFLFKDTFCSYLGRFRIHDDPIMEVDTVNKRHTFVGVESCKIKGSLENLWRNTFGSIDIKNLNVNSFSEIGALWMLVFFGIHPFNDGNGRTARLFLSVVAQYSDLELSWWPHEKAKGKKQRRYRYALRSCHLYRKRIEADFGFGTKTYWREMKKAIKPLALFFHERIVKDNKLLIEKPPEDK